MATIVAATGAAGNWTDGTAWVGGTAPTAADDAQITTLTTSITINAGAVARSADFATCTGTITFGSTGTLTLGDATAGLSNIAINIPSGMTFAPDAASVITFISTSSTQQTVAINSGYTMGNLTFNSASNGNYAMTGAITTASTSTVTLTDGTLHTDGVTDNGAYTHSWGLFRVNTGTASRTITFGNSSISLASSSPFPGSTITGQTVTANTATITFTNANPTPGFSGQNWNGLSVVYNGGGTLALSAVSGSIGTLANLTVNGTAAKTDILSLSGNLTITNSLVLAGQSPTNRILVQSTTVGTARTITNSGATMTWSNVDFMDITLGTAYDASGITGGCGDCDGNTNITFTTQTTRYWVGGTGSWSSTGEWATSSGGSSGASVPLPQDIIVFDANSFSAGSQVTTQDMTRIGRNITFAGDGAGAVTNTPGWARSVSWSTYGSITMVAGMTMSGSGATFSYRGRRSSTFTSAGFLWDNGGGGTTINAPGGKLTLQDAFMSDTNDNFTVTNGTYETNGNNHTSAFFNVSSGATWTAGGTETITVQNVGTVVSINSGATITAASSTISMTDVSTSAKTFAGGGKTYYNVSISSDGSAGTTTFTGANTFNAWTIGAAGAKSIILPGSTTTTFSAASTGLGNGTNVITFTASAGSATIACASAGMSWNYVNLTNIPASGSTPFYAGANSTDGGGNTNWTFTAPPAGGIANMKTYNTNTFANMKTINTNLKANIETFDVNA